MCGGPESALSQTSPLIRKQKAFLWRRLSREPRGGGYPEPAWRILWGEAAWPISIPTRLNAAVRGQHGLGLVYEHPRVYLLTLLLLHTEP